jgi:hypothetical protein
MSRVERRRSDGSEITTPLTADEALLITDAVNLAEGVGADAVVGCIACGRVWTADQLGDEYGPPAYRLPCNCYREGGTP